MFATYKNIYSIKQVNIFRLAANITVGKYINVNTVAKEYYTFHTVLLQNE